MLDPRRLRVLREVAARGSFTAAARALAFTQSAVSQQVAALERQAGTRLVERGVRPVRLTDAGRALLAHAEAVLARLDQAEQELGELAGLRRGRLRLASFPTAIATLVPRAVARFRERHPDVDLTVLDDHRQGLVPRLARWELDLALIYDHEALPEADVELERTHLLDDPFDLIVPDRHPLARRRSVALEELAGETWVGGTPQGADVAAAGPAPCRPDRPARAADRRRPAGGELPLRGGGVDAPRAPGDGGRRRRDAAPRRRLIGAAVGMAAPDAAEPAAPAGGVRLPQP